MKVVGLLLLLSLCGPLYAFDVESLLTEFGSLIPILLNNYSIIQGTASNVAQCSTPYLNSAAEDGAQCVKDNYPAIPSDIIDAFLNAKTAHVSVCDFLHATDPGSPLTLAFSLSGSNVANACPTGEMFSLNVPILLNNVPSVYNVYEAASIVTYSTGDTLAVVTDADGAIVSAVALTALPPGVGLDPVTGTFYVLNKDDLLAGAYNVTVSTTDAVGGKTTQTVTITLLGAICGVGLASCGIQCYNPDVHHCILYNGKFHLCIIGQIICNPVEECCYDPTLQDCINGTLCPIGNQKCGTQCYDTTAWDCVASLIIPKGFQICGLANYNPATHVCLGSTLCPIGGYQLCGGACYLPTVYTCQPNNFLCPYNNALCGDACYDTTIYDCCAATNLCPVASACGC